MKPKTNDGPKTRRTHCHQRKSKKDDNKNKPETKTHNTIPTKVESNDLPIISTRFAELIDERPFKMSDPPKKFIN